MPTPKPGQIRCPTCQQPTPPAAYCTQCGSPLPSSLQARPRGMDRAELEDRVRQRRPGDAAMRRGRAPDDVPPAAYVPFEPEPADASALRDEDPAQPGQHVDNTPPDFDAAAPVIPPGGTGEADHRAGVAAAAGHAAASSAEPDMPFPPTAAGTYQPDAYQPDAYAPPPVPATYGEAPIDEGGPYAQAPDGYAYAQPADDGRRSGGGGSNALPIIGFVLLGVLALGVGAVLATLFNGSGVAEASPSATAGSSVPASATSSSVPSVPASEPPNSTPEPTDGPVTFPDGAMITVQPCATQEMSFDGCAVDGSTVNAETMWVWIGFSDTNGSDTVVLTLRSDGETIDQQEKVLGQTVDCPGTCSGYLIGAAYRGLTPGRYELVVRRNDDFADSATFRVEG